MRYCKSLKPRSLIRARIKLFVLLHKASPAEFPRKAWYTGFSEITLNRSDQSLP